MKKDMAKDSVRTLPKTPAGKKTLTPTKHPCSYAINVVFVVFDNHFKKDSKEHASGISSSIFNKKF